jgi:hypothetical protein
LEHDGPWLESGRRTVREISLRCTGPSSSSATVTSRSSAACSRGMTYSAIARAFGCTRETVWNLVRSAPAQQVLAEWHVQADQLTIDQPLRTGLLFRWMGRGLVRLPEGCANTSFARSGAPVSPGNGAVGRPSSNTARPRDPSRNLSRAFLRRVDPWLRKRLRTTGHRRSPRRCARLRRCAIVSREMCPSIPTVEDARWRRCRVRDTRPTAARCIAVPSVWARPRHQPAAGGPISAPNLGEMVESRVVEAPASQAPGGGPPIDMAALQASYTKVDVRLAVIENAPASGRRATVNASFGG